MFSYKKNKKIINFIILILSVFLIFILYFKIKTINSVVNIILISLIFSYSLKPIRNILTERIKLNKRAASIFIILGIFIIVGIFLYILIPSILKESNNIGDIIGNIDDYIDSLYSKLKINDIEFLKNIYVIINEKLNTFLVTFSESFLTNILEGIENIISLAIIPIVTYYFLVDGELLFHKLLLILPTEKRIVIKKVLTHIDKVLSRYIVSQLFLSLIIGVITSIALLILGVNFAIPLGIFNGILNIIPYFGPIIGGLPAVFVAFISSPKKALLTALVVFLIQQIEGNILSPKITGDSTNMHPIIIIILLLIGEKLGGFVGMIIAVPIGVIIKVIYEDINDYLF
ncbi:AI-2E family transporter [Clostridium sartagoforme]|uniref:AI-2E family transporter n=1 Tax=Clostridium sartagoforme TaxID=84031 RepID=A0A4S2DNC7_9CLOT|nr:AI-2E family transporter [Clostridium sartagoforme]TGY43887.1 AI-2E family transporter [Clostridium sartagoforme]